MCSYCADIVSMTTQPDRAMLSDLHAIGGGYKRCIARIACPYASTHVSLTDIATAGGGTVSLDGHSLVQEVSDTSEGCFTVSAGKGRSRTYREDGSKLTPIEARAWRRRVAKLAAA